MIFGPLPWQNPLNARAMPCWALIAARRDNDNNVKANVMKALGNIKDLIAVDPLIAALKDEAESVRSSAASSAADALGEIRVKRTIRPLNQSLKDKSAEVQYLWVIGSHED